jgi:hypothetical protein
VTRRRSVTRSSSHRVRPARERAAVKQSPERARPAPAEAGSRSRSRGHGARASSRRPTTLVELREPALPPALFAQLSRAVRRLGTEGIRRTYQTTFWFELDGAPAAVPERAAQALAPLFRARGVRGIEWWLSRMWTHDVQVDFHRDRDERRALAGGPERHPRVSSVLFLETVRGGALAVTAQAPDPRNPALVPLPLDADLVAPRPNRLALFDGRLTHEIGRAHV